MFDKYKRQFKNALLITKQIRRGEWEFTGRYQFKDTANYTCYTAHREGLELWVAKGPIYCDIRYKPWEVGLFSFMVWYGGARANVKRVERLNKREPSDLSIKD